MKFTEGPWSFKKILPPKTLTVLTKRSKRIENEMILLVSPKFLLAVSTLRKLFRCKHMLLYMKNKQEDSEDKKKSTEHRARSSQN